MAKLTEIAWEDFANLDSEAKKPYLAREEGDGMPYHTLFAQQFDREILERLCALSNRIRFINKSKEGALYLKGLLAHKRAMLYFSQPSSRTFLSHLNACQILGLTTSSVRDAATSSEAKAESKTDTVRTFSRRGSRSRWRGSSRTASVRFRSSTPAPARTSIRRRLSSTSTR